MVFFVFLGCLCSAEILQKNETFSENHEKITIFTYANEKDHVIKRLFYGDGPIYTKVIEIYDAQNIDWYEKTEDYNVDYTNPLQPKGSNGVFYYRKGNPYEYEKNEIQQNGNYTQQKYYFVGNNKKT